MDYKEFSKKLSDHVKLLYVDHSDARLHFHNQFRAKEIVDTAKAISAHYNVDERTHFIINAACWFYDTGHLAAGLESEETKSAGVAEIFLRNHGIADEDILEIKNCILIGKNEHGEHHEHSLAEKIVNDASIYYLGTKEFPQKNKLLRKEVEAFANGDVSGMEWRQRVIHLFETRHYMTEYCQQQLDATKTANLLELQNKQHQKLRDGMYPSANLSGTDKDPLTIPADSETAGDPATSRKVLGGKKNLVPVRGFETVFRVSSAKNQRLSVMADNKAHIMISVNSIIISVALALVVRKLDTDKDLRNLIIPTFILLMVNTITIIYSVLATRSRIPKGVFTPEEVKNKSVNLLFFGNYYKMSFEEYEAGMKRVMSDSDFLYGSMISDLYWEGKVLGRKYSLLRTSYNIFMYGICLAVLAYIVVFLFMK